MATQFEIDCALMAGASYLSNRDPINRFPGTKGTGVDFFLTKGTGVDFFLMN